MPRATRVAGSTKVNRSVLSLRQFAGETPSTDGIRCCGQTQGQWEGTLAEQRADRLQRCRSVGTDGPGRILKDAYVVRGRGEGQRKFGENPRVERCVRGLETVWNVWEMGCHCCWNDMGRVDCGGDKSHQRQGGTAYGGLVPS